MERNCKNCVYSFSACSGFVPFTEVGCSEFEPKSKKYVLVHVYRETGFRSIVCFSDSYEELFDIMQLQPRFGSSRHNFLICYNQNYPSIQYLKDSNLINICKNVAEYLAIGEYSMLKKSYFNASSWFEKAKNSAALGADIIDNY